MAGVVCILIPAELQVNLVFIVFTLHTQLQMLLTIQCAFVICFCSKQIHWFCVFVCIVSFSAFHTNKYIHFFLLYVCVCVCCGTQHMLCACLYLLDACFDWIFVVIHFHKIDFNCIFFIGILLTLSRINVQWLMEFIRHHRNVCRITANIRTDADIYFIAL